MFLFSANRFEMIIVMAQFVLESLLSCLALWTLSENQLRIHWPTFGSWFLNFFKMLSTWGMLRGEIIRIFYIPYLSHIDSPENMGLLDPSTTDGRVIFFLPWLGNVVAGTTDKPCEVSHEPRPTEEEVEFILSEIKHYLSPDIKGELFHLLVSVVLFIHVPH